MAKTISELRNQSIQVRDASAAGENTATRVGTVLNDIVGHIEDYENTQSSNNSTQDAKIEGVKSSLNAEIARAKTEESNLSNLIGTERTERQAAVSSEETARIQADNAEKTARMTADNAEQDARIQADNTEKTARENADITLRTIIQTETSDREKAVAAEAARAMAAEKLNADAIATEEARAMAAEEAETSRATTEEERLQGEIDNTNNNINSLDDKVNSNKDHLTDEVARLDLTDNEIKANLEAEAARAKAAEEANATAIAEEKAAIMGTDRIADGSVTTEKVADGAVTTEKIKDAAVTYDKLQAEIKEVIEGTRYTENPEFLRYYCDADGRLTWWIYPDGSIDWASGIPKPVQDELRKLEKLINDNLTGDEQLKERVAANEEAIAAINEALDRKVDGVYEDNPEYIKVLQDSDDRVLNAITPDGTNYFPKANVDELSLDGEDVDNDALKSQTFEECQEFVNVIKDSDDRILFGIDNNGDINSEYLNKIKKAIPDKEGFVLKSDIDYNTFAKKILDSKTMEFATLFPKSGECESFLFFTDPHLGGANNNFDIDTFYEAMGVVKKYFDTTPTSFVLSGGDWLNAKDYQANACEKLGFIDAYMSSHFNSYFPIFGNHDCNYQGIVSADDDSNGNLSNQVLSNLMFRKWGRKYYTFKESITRFYIFDTGIDWNNAMTGEWVEGNYRWEQIEWFTNQLIENNDTHIALGMHIISNGNVENWQNGKSEFFKNVIAIAKAFNNKSSITLNEHSYDFTGKEGTIHFVIAGHSHFDYVDESEGIPIIITTNMYKLSVVNFDLIICDYSNHKLHTIRIGYGNNRSITIK